MSRCSINEATYLGKLGENVTDVSQLWQFAIMQADGLSPVPVLSDATDISVPSAGPGARVSAARPPIRSSARNTFGPLGYGWTDNWNYSLAVGSDGTVTVTMPSGQERIFQPDSRYPGVYFSQPGDTGILTKAPAGCSLSTNRTATPRSSTTARSIISRIRKGTRFSPAILPARLASLTSSSGGQLTIGYNAAGLIASVAGLTQLALAAGITRFNTTETADGTTK